MRLLATGEQASVISAPCGSLGPSPVTSGVAVSDRNPLDTRGGPARATIRRLVRPLPAVLVVLGASVGLGSAAGRARASAYDALIRSHNPAMYLAMSSPGSGSEVDLTGRGHTGTYHPRGRRSAIAALPNGDRAADFDSRLRQYLQVPDANDLSVTSRGRLTVEAWIRPDTLQFPQQEGRGYVHLLGKGEANQQEYALRMYSKANSETPPRPNRISAYAFSLAGGLGSGSYFQDPVSARSWIFVAFAINMKETSAAYPTGYVKIYKNGVLHDTTGLDQFGVVPRNGTAPFRVGTRDFASFFDGAVGKVAVYLHELAPERIRAHYAAMVRR